MKRRRRDGVSCSWFGWFAATNLRTIITTYMRIIPIMTFSPFNRFPPKELFLLMCDCAFDLLVGDKRAVFRLAHARLLVTAILL